MARFLSEELQTTFHSQILLETGAGGLFRRHGRSTGLSLAFDFCQSQTGNSDNVGHPTDFGLPEVGLHTGLPVSDRKCRQCRLSDGLWSAGSRSTYWATC